VKKENRPFHLCQDRKLRKENRKKKDTKEDHPSPFTQKPSSYIYAIDSLFPPKWNLFTISNCPPSIEVDIPNLHHSSYPIILSSYPPTTNLRKIREKENKGKTPLTPTTLSSPFSLAIRRVDFQPGSTGPDFRGTSPLQGLPCRPSFIIIPSQELPVALVQIAILMNSMLQPPSRLSF
jgi:hypothetical protein